MDQLIEFAMILWEAFLKAVPIYDEWCLVGVLAILSAVVFYRLFEMVATSHGRGMSKNLAVIREIANLPEANIEEMRRKNEPELIDQLVVEAKGTLEDLESLSRKPRNDAEIKRYRALKLRIEVNLVVLPERYQALKRGGQFSQFQGS